MVKPYINVRDCCMDLKRNLIYCLSEERKNLNFFVGDAAPASIPDRTSNKVMSKVSFPRG